MSETQINQDRSFTQTHKVPSRNLANAKTGSQVHKDESSEYDSEEEEDKVDSFSQYGNRANMVGARQSPSPIKKQPMAKIQRPEMRKAPS